ncbi:Phosphoribosylaminoimidazole-succinocarboxamide synthase (SAICAR synthetase) [Candidatus Glomeribacter gigasporarum BEG34]|uniref:Phosphoribosylaminoimidazole-succinocarboxamide synthase n=1 Tax=Candidatus Glomeribacter gigasporarum BEG34 TaxID=1070319 RepID=G2JBW1_9BURK|nr:phosphoribosylaminoimidazolesuccinocarboxamide synthase [Candidatus Glomeribacter gigasporarum]CCD30267.1 Phosphoribosylaminoimidazole-succinocarboxamide synthase (SAICAR synthetase) [Candidatus Glomeribacter gigasporarum BEG34]
MTHPSSLYRSALHSLPLVGRGKVRDNYAVGNDRLLIVTTDRLSAFDIILDEPIPNKGCVLNKISNFWFGKLAYIVPNHLTDIAPETVVSADEARQVAGRAVVVKRLKPILIEAVVRGYVAGGGWNEYQKHGTISGIRLPTGLQYAQQLPEPIFTPTTKAAQGAHDEPISFAEAEARIGRACAQRIREISLQLYTEAAAYAQTRGILIADTKFEFGLDENGTLVWMDEAFTPDSSRFWPADQYQPSVRPPAFDKQFVRDWLNAQAWSKTPPAPSLPADIVRKTAQRYCEALQRLTG